MTTPADVPAGIVTLPEPGYPMLMNLISDAMLPSPDRANEAIWWVVGKSHPYVPEMNVMRMFVAPGGVEVYSVSTDGKTGMRDLVPTRMVRLIQEAMPLDVFVDELTESEEEADGDDAPEVPAPANGQAAS